jgi:hypothetical protein
VVYFANDDFSFELGIGRLLVLYYDFVSVHRGCG